MQILRNFFCCIKIDFQKELKEIRNVENQKLEILRQKHKHTYDAVMWYKQNKEKFEGVVHRSNTNYNKRKLFIKKFN
jgi:hypothetical protein